MIDIAPTPTALDGWSKYASKQIKMADGRHLEQEALHMQTAQGPHGAPKIRNFALE